MYNSEIRTVYFRTISQKKNKIILQFIILFLILQGNAYAQQEVLRIDTLGGLLPKMVKAKTYIVNVDIEVPANTIVTIEPGTVILFKNFTGLKIRGRLLALGSKSKPIIFSSVHDKKYNPSSSLLANPFDWNGIYIYADAIGTIMENCVVTYSVYGVISDTKFIKMDRIHFADNGKYDFFVEKEEKKIVTEWYSYTLAQQDIEKLKLNVELFQDDPLKGKRLTFRYASLALFIGGIGIGAYSSYQFKEIYSEWKKINRYPPDENLLNTKDESYYKSVRKRKNSELAKAISGSGVALVSVIAFVWTFTF
jgi:hypothetical protein